MRIFHWYLGSIVNNWGDAFCFSWLGWNPDIISILDRNEMYRNGLSWYKYADMVIAMRGHAQIVPIGLGTPTISWSSQDKQVGLMHKLGLDNWNVDVHEENQKFVQRTIDLIDLVESERTTISYYYKKELLKMRGLVEEEFKLISQRIGEY